MSDYDVIFVGGGLANGLAAYCLHKQQPQLRLLVLERSSTLGGQHTWSFHDSDLKSSSLLWVTPFITRHWDNYEVRFPKYTRVLHSGYNSVRSDQFHEVLMGSLGAFVRTDVTVELVGAESVRLRGGDVLRAGLVLDGRGWEPCSGVRVAYQKFFGEHLVLERPHGLVHPVLMDARCSQEDGYRFFYVLPWGEREVFVEDTHYSDTPAVDVALYKDQIASYCREQGWRIESVAYEEIGSLPIPLNGDLPVWEGTVAKTGVGAGLFHATTGYSFPNAIRFAEELASLEVTGDALNFARFREAAEAHWSGDAFFRFLNRMLFRAALPEKRYQVLERFYRLSPDLIQRFYRGQLKRSDYCRLLIGKPPVPIFRALQCLSPRMRVA